MNNVPLISVILHIFVYQQHFLRQFFEKQSTALLIIVYNFKIISPHWSSYISISSINFSFI